MSESDDFTNFAVGIDVINSGYGAINSGYKIFSNALASSTNNEQRFELKDMIESYINKKDNLSDEIKTQLIETLDNSLPYENEGGKKHKKSIKTKKPTKSRKTRKNN